VTPWDWPWPRILRKLRVDYRFSKAEVLALTDYELDMWLRDEKSLEWRRDAERREARAKEVASLMRRRIAETGRP